MKEHQIQITLTEGQLRRLLQEAAEKARGECVDICRRVASAEGLHMDDCPGFYYLDTGEGCADAILDSMGFS